MPDELLDPTEAARRLGITRPTLYDWLGRSRRSLLEIHGRRVTIEFLQTGAKSQGRIRIDAREVERLRELMRVRPQGLVPRARPSVRPAQWPGIHVSLGRPR